MLKKRSGTQKKAEVDKGWLTLSLAAYGRFLTSHVLEDELLQSIMLSTFPYDRNSKLTFIEPFYVFSCFVSTMQVLLPDRLCVLPNEGLCSPAAHPSQACTAYQLRGAFRYSLIQTLLCQSGSPTSLTILLGLLYRSLDVPCRICLGYHEPEHYIALSYDQRRQILQAQLEPDSSSKSNTLTKFPVVGTPLIWLEVYWPEVKSYVGVELYSKQFNFQNEYNGIPHPMGQHFQGTDLTPKKLKIHMRDVFARLTPIIIRPEERPPEEEVTTNTMFLFGGGGSDSDDSDSESEEEGATDRDRPPSLETQEVQLLVTPGGVNKSRKNLLETMALQASLIATPQEKLASNPFQKYVKMQGNDAVGVECYFTKALKFAIAIEANLTIRDVSVRYLNTSGLSRLKSYRKLIRNCIAIYDQIASGDLDPKLTHYLELDEANLRSLMNRFEMPNSLSAFKESEVYVLPSTLTTKEYLMETETPIGFFKGEKVFLRKDVRRLKSRREWEDSGRIVNPGERPKKILQRKDRTGTINAVEQFTEEQTSPITNETYVKGRAGDRSSHYVVCKGGILPEDWVHLSATAFPGIQRAARLLGIPYQIAIIDFKFNGNSYDSIKDGIVVHKDHEASVLHKQKEVAIWIEREELAANKERSIQWWRVLLKMIAAVSSD